MKPLIPLAFMLAFLFSCNAAPYLSDYAKYIRFHWKGAIQSHSITLKIFPYLDQLVGLNTFLILYTKSAGAPVPPSATQVTFVTETYPVSEVTLSNLSPKTQYFYTFIFTQDSIIDPSIFLTYYSSNTVQEFPFRTLEFALKPYNFTFGAASCAQTGSTSSVFKNIIDENFDFFLHMGDIHYESINVDDTNLFYEAYYKVFASPQQRKFFETVPTFYNWDDHDFGPNDAEGTSPSKPAVTTAYKKFVPYTNLKNRLPIDDSSISPDAPAQVAEKPGMYLNYNTETYGIFRSFVVGRCLFIILDLRSFKDVIPEDIVGNEQRSWLENQLRFAGYNQGIKMVFMISSIPWLTGDTSFSEWKDFGANQQWIGQMVRQYIYGNKKEILLLAGDAHMIGLDDGRNNPMGGFPVVQAAALDQFPSWKGGPYSHGREPGRGQYGRFEVTDTVSEGICINIELKRYGANVITYNTCYPELHPLQANQDGLGSLGRILIGVFVGVFVLGSAGVGAYIYRKRKLRRRVSVESQRPNQEASVSRVEDPKTLHDE